jgi:hypothetical protein
MVVFCCGLVWLLRSILVSLTENEVRHPMLVSFLYGILLVTWFRVFVAVVVRRSIRKGIQILSKEILRERQRGARADRFLLIGFSWGGAVRCCHSSSFISRGKNEGGTWRGGGREKCQQNVIRIVLGLRCLT